ncbi:MAG: glycosyl transferase, partial [Chitinophagaceae bacterium]|nr:glycosyl transferase [Chitinophagaceae bacterium]
SKGLSLYFNSTGGLDYWKILRGFHPLNLHKEVHELPVEKYDLVINDFEYITSAACAKKRIPSVHLGHQASFQSKLTPRPANKNAIGEWVLKNYARATHNIGLHFECYDDFILPPVIKQEILDAEPVNKAHITVYLPSCSADFLEKILPPIRDLHFHVFAKEIKNTVRKSNITFFPVGKTLFNKSMIKCEGIICGAGFETPAEAIYLQKKMICIPTRGQYEQLCNAASLEKIGIRCLKKIGDDFSTTLYQWLEEKKTITVNYGHTMSMIMDRLWQVHEKMNSHVVNDYPVWPAGEFA